MKKIKAYMSLHLMKKAIRSNILPANAGEHYKIIKKAGLSSKLDAYKEKFKR